MKNRDRSVASGLLSSLLPPSSRWTPVHARGLTESAALFIFQSCISASGFICLCLLLCPLPADAQRPLAREERNESIVVEHADTWLTTGLDEIFELIGHVRIRHGATLMTGRRVVYQRQSGEVVLDGDVRLQRDRSVLSADHVVYYEGLRQAVGTGAVRVVDTEEGATLTGSRVEYFHRPRRAIVTGKPRLELRRDREEVDITAWRLEYIFGEADSSARALGRDSVLVVDRAESVSVACDQVEYRRKEHRAYFTGSPRFIRWPDDVGRAVTITGVSMGYAFENKQADVMDSVRIRRGSLQGQCDTLRYLGEEQQVFMTGQPFIRDANSAMRGERIFIQLAGGRVSGAVITGRASGNYAPDDSAGLRQGVIAGRELTVEFQDDAVRSITAVQNAVSEYYPSGSSGDGPPGQNIVRAARIGIQLDHGRLLQVSAQGSVEGVYQSPERASSP